MPVFDPFSAASKPMPDWDAMPSKPLPFAATLHALDINAMPAPGQSHRLPRPLRQDEFPKAFPTPAYGHARHGSVSAAPPSPSSHVAIVGSDQWWKQKVGQCVDNANGDLVVSDCELETLSTRIIDLRDLVTFSHLHSPNASPSTSTAGPVHTLSPRSPLGLPSLSPQSATTGERTFTRTQSAPASAAFFSHLRGSEPQQTQGSGGLLPAPEISSRPFRPAEGQQKRFARSKTGVARFNRSAPNVGIYAQHNKLYTLPTALFEIRNLTVLSLRRNRLTSLPAAIGELVNLIELNISSNQISYLPSTILNLKALEQFSANPNPWLKPPPSEDGNDAPSRVFSPLKSNVSGNVPRLTSMSLSVLLSPTLPTHQAPFTKYDWNEVSVDGQHPLLNPELLDTLMPPCMGIEDAVRVQQAVRSAAVEAPKGRSQSRIDGIPTHDPPPDDASTNPYYNPCPSPRHLEWDVAADAHRQTRRVFLHPAEERFEWVEIAKTKDIPIQWLGCSPGCLAFLEDEEDDWPLDDGFEWGQ